MIAAPDAAKLLDLIADRAQALRERGVRRVELGNGVAFTLVGPEPEPASAAAAPAAEDDSPPIDPLHDPWTHGRPQPGSPRTTPRRTRMPLVSESDQ